MKFDHCQVNSKSGKSPSRATGSRGRPSARGRRSRAKHPRGEQEVGREPPVPMEEPAQAATAPAPRATSVVVRVLEHRRVVLVHLRKRLVGRERQRVRGRLRIELHRIGLHVFDRRDVVRPEGPLRGDQRVVHEVHVRRGRRHTRPERDDHVVGPDDPAVVGSAPVHVRVGEVGDIAGPRHRRRKSPFARTGA